MYIYALFVLQIIVVTIFLFQERRSPATSYSRDKSWWLMFFGVNLVTIIWMQIFWYFWRNLNIDPIIAASFDGLSGAFMFYLIFSLGNYWLHRFKHSNKFMWRLHKLHHAPQQMETLMMIFRSPFESIFNTVYMIVLGKVIFGVNFEVIVSILVIEGCLEAFHHSNIKTPKRLYWLGYFIQTPEMHLTHHEMGKHKNNYSPVFWDSVFGTYEWDKRSEKKLGLKASLHEYIW